MLKRTRTVGVVSFVVVLAGCSGGDDVIEYPDAMGGCTYGCPPDATIPVPDATVPVPDALVPVADAAPCIPLPIELCNGVDDDCDGLVDEDYPDTGDPCTEGTGACEQQGITVCINGNVHCTATPGDPSDEICNAIDDDCDGMIDEGVPCI